MVKFCRIFFFLVILSSSGYAQVNAVQYGKNRLQFKKFKWDYFQSRNFNVYYSENGEELAKFVAQCAEKELPDIEQKAEYSLQRRANIILYNHYTDYSQSNIGLETFQLTTGGTAKLVNNKLMVYYDANHEHLRLQIRKGIADVIVRNMLFGDDLGEVAGNQTLMNFPQWFTDGYIAYLGENWSTELDEELKSEILSGNYSKFSALAFEKPLLAGHAFWYFIEEKYKKENTAYFLYLSKVYKNLNKSCEQITKKKFKDLLLEFMEYQDEKYYNDIARRKAYPKGNVVESFDISKNINYYRFNVNPNKKNNTYVVTRFKKGVVEVLLSEDFEFRTLLKYGTRKYENEIHPHYPMMAWDPKGTRICVVYPENGRLKMFVYDVVNKYRQYKFDLTDRFDQIQDVTYMIDSKTLLISAVRNGQSDLFTFDLDKEKLVQVTDDVYDDLDASFVAFPGKTGILFSSNRPDAQAKGGDTALPSDNRFNVFMITDYGDKPELNQITRLSALKYGNARFPMQYNVNHFTFISDESGIGNRYAGFFVTKSAGLDTLVLIGEDILRNPSQTDIDSSLKAQNKEAVDSIAVVAVSEDSSYTFPITNYPSSVAETRIAGEKNQVSEVTRQSDEKTLYKLKIDDNALGKRNINATPTEYMKKRMRESKLTKVAPAAVIRDTVRTEDVFQGEFSDQDTMQKEIVVRSDESENPALLRNMKKFPYNPLKFSADMGSIGFNNNVLLNKYQAYQYGAGPITLNSGTPLEGMIRLGASDMMEDIRFMGGFRLSTNLKDNEWYFGFQHLKRRLDWSLAYYRNVQGAGGIILKDGVVVDDGLAKVYTNLYQGGISYPLNENSRLMLNTGIRSDNTAVSTLDPISASINSQRTLFSLTHFEYVYDNSMNPTMNIWNGLRYKFYFDWNRQVGKINKPEGPYTFTLGQPGENTSAAGRTAFNFGFDARYYYPIYRHFIWAGRAAGDFSWGNQKICYYLGGVDGWLMFGQNQKQLSNGSIKERFYNTSNQPDPDQFYAFQSLAVNMRGYIQNIANGNNAVVLNSEFRLPVMSTFFDKIVSNSFLQNLMVVQFIDLGTAWNGAYRSIQRPSFLYNTPDIQGNPGPVTVKIKTGGIGPFAGGYGFGLRSTVLGYYLKFDCSWPMGAFFRGPAITYFALGLDF